MWIGNLGVEEQLEHWVILHLIQNALQLYCHLFISKLDCSALLDETPVLVLGFGMRECTTGPVEGPTQDPAPLASSL